MKTEKWFLWVSIFGLKLVVIWWFWCPGCFAEVWGSNLVRGVFSMMGVRGCGCMCGCDVVAVPRVKGGGRGKRGIERR